jgi:hypothetical protein
MHPPLQHDPVHIAKGLKLLAGVAPSKNTLCIVPLRVTPYPRRERLPHSRFQGPTSFLRHLAVTLYPFPHL